MALYENLSSFGGKPVVDFREAGDIKDFASVTPRLRCEYSDNRTIKDYLGVMLAQPGVEAIDALVFGVWMENGEGYEVTPRAAIDALVAAKDRLPNIDSLFFGDIISEENEMSWIYQTDYDAIWAAFPELDYVAVRGGEGLSLGNVRHRALKTLIVQTGGLSGDVARQALAAQAPLEHLELWLGDEEYGADTSVADFATLFSGSLFPALKTLGLRNSQYSDAIAEAVVKAPLLERLSVLDLSMGTLTDAGARALIASGKVGHLAKLDISHHYVSEAVVEELRKVTPNLIADEPQEADEWDGKAHYYVAVGE